MRIDSADRLVEVGVELRNGALLGWIAPLGLALAVLTWWLYRRSASHVPPFRRRLLVFLRTGLIWLLLALLLRPVLDLRGRGQGAPVHRLPARHQREHENRRPATGQRRPQARRHRHGLLPARGGLNQTLDPAKSAQVKQIPRIELLKDVLQNRDLALLERLRKDYDIVPFRFRSDRRRPRRGGGQPGCGSFTGPGPRRRQRRRTPPPAWLKGLDTTSHFTAIGDAVRGRAPAPARAAAGGHFPRHRRRQQPRRVAPGRRLLRGQRERAALHLRGGHHVAARHHRVEHLSRRRSPSRATRSP